MNVTDYRKEQSTMQGPILPSRFGAYLLDVLKQWFADSRNNPVEALKGLKYVEGDSISALNTANVFLGIEWPEDQRVSGKTPAVLVSYGNLVSAPQGTAISMAASHFPGHMKCINMSYDIALIVRTAAYAGTQVLAEALFTYLSTYAKRIAEDAGLSSFAALQMSQPTISQSPGDSKDVFSASIVCKVTCVYMSATDTTGPVFRGIALKSNI